MSSSLHELVLVKHEVTRRQLHQHVHASRGRSALTLKRVSRRLPALTLGSHTLLALYGS